MSARINWNRLADEVLSIEDRPVADEAVPTRAARPPGRWTTVRHSLVWYLLRRQTPWIVALVILGVILLALTFLTADLTASIFDDAIIDQTRSLDGLVTSLALVAALSFVFGFANAQVSSRIGYQLEFDLRNLLYLRLQRAVPHDLDEVSTGQMVTRAITDLRVLELVIRLVPGLMQGLPILLGIVLFMFFQSIPLTVVAVSAIPINAYLINRIRKRLWGLAFLSLNQKAEITTAIDEPVRGIRVVKAFGQEEAERERVGDAARTAYRYVMTRVRLEARYDLLLRAAPVLVRAGLLLVGARFVVAGQLSLGQFTVFLGFAAVFSGLALVIDELVAAWQLAKSGVGRMFQLLTMSPRLPAGVVHVPLPAERTGLEARGLGVSYGNQIVLSGIDLSVGAGEMVVLTGPAGAGASTLAAVLTGQFPPSEGEVHLDGVDIAALDPDALAREVRVVTEDSFLFARTVRANLLLGSLRHATATQITVSDADLRAALWAAAAEEVVGDLDHGLDEVLGDRGMTLSGGQRQRLALARALVSPPRVLVLDDALSAVNPSLEVEILERIRAHAPTTAVICISRRPGPQHLADRVVVLSSPPSSAHDEQAPAPATALPAAQFAAPAAPGAPGSAPYDPRLGPIIAGLTIADDSPRVSDELASDSELRPGFWSTIRPLFWWMVLATVVLVAMTGVGLAPEYILGDAADAIEVENTSLTDRYALYIVLLAGATGVLSYWFRILAARISEDVLYLLRRRIFSRLSRMGIDYYDRELPGQVSARVVHDLDVLSTFFDGGLYLLVSSVALFVMALGVIAFVSQSLTIVLMVLGFALVVIVATAVQVPVANRAFRRARVATGDVVARLQEDFAGRYAVSAFGAERQARLEFGAVALDLRSARRWATTVANLYTELVGLMGAVAVAMIFLQAGNLAIAGAITTGMVLQLRLFLSEAMRPIPTMGRIWQDYLQAQVAMDQLAHPYRTPVLPVETDDAVECTTLSGRIRFDGVEFTYPGTSRQVLHGIDLDIAAGSTVAIVGYTGAGKSSIAKLLTRVYDPDVGRVLVDEHDVRSLQLGSFRRHLGIVPQDAFVFRGTVASNIAYGRPHSARAEIEAAARAVGADSALAALRHGYDTPVEEEGRNLTGAQLQLIALARAWLVAPDVLVLDEATSNLDPDTEAQVLDAVAALGCTTVLIAHRRLVAERADVVVLMDRGRVVATGTHAELIDSNDRYASLWASEGASMESTS